MTNNNFDEALRRVLVSEGGTSNNPHDRGGLTRNGITQKVYDAWRSQQGQPPNPVTMINPLEVKTIYKEQYADAIRFDLLPSGLDYCVFDAAVNSGPLQAIKWLQLALGVTADGHFGQVTLDALSPLTDHQDLIDQAIDDVSDARKRFVRALNSYPTFGKGWDSRIEHVRDVALHEGQSGVPEAVKHESAKALATNAKPLPDKTLSGIVQGVGASGAALTGSLAAIKDSLQPLADSSQTIQVTIAVMGIVSVLIGLGGVLWGIWQGKQTQEITEALS
jgi:lysozyme family protein